MADDQHDGPQPEASPPDAEEIEAPGRSTQSDPSPSVSGAAGNPGGADASPQPEVRSQDSGSEDPARTEAGAAPDSDDADRSDELLDTGDIEALLDQQGKETSPGASSEDRTERLLDQAESDLAAAVSPLLSSEKEGLSALGRPEPFDFTPFDGASSADAPGGVGLDALGDVELDLRIELGRTELLIDEVLKLKQGAVVPLDKLAGDPVDILVNGRIIARGEVLVLNDNFCVRVAEILTPEG